MTRATTDDLSFTKTPGEEPLPGYRLIEPLGRGGFGEVWKCEAPGGLLKAIKFVAGDLDDTRREDTSLLQELDAFQQIKAIRHPFLLTLERVELIGGELVMVMELADRQLLNRFDECRAQGLPGVPREELIGYFADAAEALDVISTKHGLQHLDVKPANLFLIDNHVKVGDYGLVARLEKPGAGGGGRPTRGLTPRYVAPEVIEGQVDHRSDQYSLALVYQEMLTGTFPFRAKSAAQMLLMHAMQPPDLSSLPEPDQPIIARALAKKPVDRFDSCLEFISALAALTPPPAGANPQVLASGAIRRLTRSRPIEPPAIRSPDYPTPRSSDAATAWGPTGRPPGLPPLTAPGQVGSRPSARPPRRPDPEEAGVVELVATPPPAATTPALQLSGGHPSPGEAVTQLERIWSVVPTVRLAGQGDGPALVPAAADVAALVVRAAVGGAVPPRFSGDPVRRLDGVWVSQVLLKPVHGVVKLKLQSLAEQWQAELNDLGPDLLAVRVYASPGFWGRWSAKKSGLELVIQLPPAGQSIGEAQLTGRLFGTPDATFARSADEVLPQMMEETRRQIQNTDDRRKSPRIAADFPVSVFPITSDGGVFPMVPGRCRDISAEGVRLVAERPVETRYAFISFEGVPDAAGWGLLTRLLRTRPVEGGQEVAGRFRMDI